MNVLVSGGSGFLGSCVVKELIDSNHDVTVISRNPNSVKRLSEIKNKIKITNFSILEKNWIQRFDAVINCATSYGRDNENISEIITANTLNPIRLLESMKDGSLYINCDTFYNKNGRLYYPLLNYSMSKHQTRQWLIEESKEKNVKIVNLVFEHIYGPHDSNHKFIPFLIQTMLDNAPELALTSCKINRDFIYVDDAANAICSIVNNLHRLTNSWNELQVGTGKSTSLKDIVLAIKDKTRYSGMIHFGKRPDRLKEIKESFADLRKWNELSINWSSRVNLDTGLKNTIKSYE